MDYSINQFWKNKFSGVAHPAAIKQLDGWTDGCQNDESYIPAKLTLRKDFNDLTQNVWLIAAPGAVGKSTLAKEICATTGAVYVDLATAATVAGNYMVGGLVYSNLLASWTTGQTAVLIDALDEARLRVTQSGFEAFLSDIAAVAKMGKFPVVILGRVGIIEEAWIVLNERDGLEPPIFDIELFDTAEAELFVMAVLVKLSTKTNSSNKLEYPDLARTLVQHRSVYVDAIQRVVAGLQALSAQDANRFVGYAPVLDAVAKVIASESNPAHINDEMQRVLEGKVLISLANEILRREAGKLVMQVSNSVANLPDKLYDPKEQLERLASKLFKLPPPPIPIQLVQHQVSAYEQAVQNLLPQHPFLDGTGGAPSSAVFEACIVAAALKSDRKDLVTIAERHISLIQHTANPFLHDFYLGDAEKEPRIPTEHIGLVFESVLAKSTQGDTVRLGVEGNVEDGLLDVEILIARPGEEAKRLSFTAPVSGTIRLGRRIAGVSIDADETTVELGAGDQLELIAPTSINARSLKLSCNQVVVKAEPHATEEDVVILEAAVLIADPAISPPAVRTGAQLQVSWPNATSYPWTTFAAPTIQEESPKTADALRALRRFAMAFRSHSKGKLARFRDKIEHSRMLKGPVGDAVLNKLIQDQVIYLDGPMYYLMPDVLGLKVGVSFLDIKLKRYSPKAREYVQGLVN